MASVTGIPQQNPARDEEEPLLGRPGDVTQKPEQSLFANLITGTAVVAQAGIWILAALVWAGVFEASPLIFFSYHPLVNSAGILFLTQAILILQPTASHQQKIYGTYWHSLFNFLGVAALISGLVIVEMNKASHPESRFTSTHGILGLVTYILIFLQALVGFAQFYFPSMFFGSVDNGKALYKYHRASGYLILLMSLATICFATQTTFNVNALHIRLWAVIVASVLIIAGVAPRVKLHKFGI